MITCMATDFGNILGTFKPRVEVLRSIAELVTERHQCIVGGKSIESLFSADNNLSANQEQYYDKLDTGEMSVRSLWKDFLRHLGLEEHHCCFEFFRELWCDHQKLIMPMVELYREIQERYPLVGISNGDPESLSYFTNLLVKKGRLRFHRIFLSGAKQLKKPGLFQTVQFELNHEVKLRKGTWIYVDDVPAYVRGAQRNGFEAFQFNATSFPNFQVAADTMRAELIARGMQLSRAKGAY